MGIDTAVKPGRKENEVMRVSRLAGERLYRVRTSLGIKSHQVIEACPKIHKSNLSDWESGSKSIPLWAIRDLSVLYGVSIDYVLGVCDELTESRSALEIKEAVHAAAYGYVSVLSERISGAIGNQAVKMHCYEETSQASRLLAEQVERMIDLNRAWFEEEVRNGANVLNALQKYKQVNATLEIAQKKHRLADLMPLKTQDLMQTSLDL